MKASPLLAAAALLGIAAADAATINVSGADISGSITYDGITWNRVDNSPAPAPFELLLANGTASGIDLTFTPAASGNFANNTSGQGDPGAAGSNANFSWSTGANSGVTMNSTGQFFPWPVLDSSVANNNGTSSLYSLTLTSATQYYFKFTLAASRTGIAGGETSYNIGGTYDGTTDSFTGGTTLNLTAGTDQAVGVEFDMGQLTTGSDGFLSTWNGSAYTITLQVGANGNPSGSDAAYLNGLIIATAAVPEPSVGFIMFAGLGGLALLRRRGR